MSAEVRGGRFRQTSAPAALGSRWLSYTAARCRLWGFRLGTPLTYGTSKGTCSKHLYRETTGSLLLKVWRKTGSRTLSCLIPVLRTSMRLISKRGRKRIVRFACLRVRRCWHPSGIQTCSRPTTKRFSLGGSRNTKSASNCSTPGSAVAGALTWARMSPSAAKPKKPLSQISRGRTASSLQVSSREISAIQQETTELLLMPRRLRRPRGARRFVEAWGGRRDFRGCR